MLISALLAIIIVFTIGIIALDHFFLRNLIRLQRVIFHSILAFCFLMTLFSVTLFFNYEVISRIYFGMIIMSLVFSIILGIGNYYALKYNDGRIERLREKYSQLPDSPKKQSMLKLLDKLEKDSKK